MVMGNAKSLCGCGWKLIISVLVLEAMGSDGDDEVKN